MASNGCSVQVRRGIDCGPLFHFPSPRPIAVVLSKGRIDFDFFLNATPYLLAIGLELASMSNLLRVQCPGCHTTLRMKEELRGKQVACPKCEARLRWPEVSEAIEVTPIDPSDSPPMKSSTIWDDESFLTSSIPPPVMLPAITPGQVQSNPYIHNQQNNASSLDSYQTGNPNSSFGPITSKKRLRYEDYDDEERDGELSEADANLQSTGIYLVVIPVLAAILPLFGLQLRRLARSGEYAPLGAMILGFLGAGIIVYARRNRSDATIAGAIAVAVTLIFGVGGFLLQTAEFPIETRKAGDKVIITPADKARQEEARRQFEERTSHMQEEQIRLSQQAAERFERSEARAPQLFPDVTVNAGPPHRSPNPSGSSFRENLHEEPPIRASETANIPSRIPSNARLELLSQDPEVMFQLMKAYHRGSTQFVRLRIDGKKLVRKNSVGSDGSIGQVYLDDPVTSICGLSIGKQLTIVPITTAEAAAKYAVRASDDRQLHGLRFAFEGSSIVGYQGLLSSKSTSEVIETEWFGRHTKDIRESLNPKPGRSGMVCYCNGFGFCGFAWLER